MIKKFIFSALALLALVFFSPWFLGFIFQDSALEEYADLEVKQLVVEEGENAYFDLKEIEGAIYNPDDELLGSHLRGETWEEDFVTDVLEKNGALFEILDRASEKKAYQEPGYAHLSTLTLEEGIPTVLSLPASARISALRAIALQKEGKEVEAFEETLRTLKLSQMVQEAQGVLIQQLIAITMTEVSLEAGSRLVQASTLSTPDLVLYEEQFEDFYEIRPSVAEAVKVENQLVWNTIDVLEEMEGGIFKSLASGFPSNEYYLPGFGLSYYLHPNETKALLAEQSREIIFNLQKDCSEVERIEMDFSSESEGALYFTENALGKLLFQALQSNINVASFVCEKEEKFAGLKNLL